MSVGDGCDSTRRSRVRRRSWGRRAGVGRLPACHGRRTAPARVTTCAVISSRNGHRFELGAGRFVSFWPVPRLAATTAPAPPLAFDSLSKSWCVGSPLRRRAGGGSPSSSRALASHLVGQLSECVSTLCCRGGARFHPRAVISGGRRRTWSSRATCSRRVFALRSQLAASETLLSSAKLFTVHPRWSESILRPTQAAKREAERRVWWCSLGASQAAFPIRLNRRARAPKPRIRPLTQRGTKASTAGHSTGGVRPASATGRPPACRGSAAPPRSPLRSVSSASAQCFPTTSGTSTSPAGTVSSSNSLGGAPRSDSTCCACCPIICREPSCAGLRSCHERYECAGLLF